ncbi:MAG: hypothetical protein JNL11_13470 [Bdellovibrionaceae bacterium]|nr:hypothetical protein [Pseudobdellovibrionaceae bacterium]
MKWEKFGRIFEVPNTFEWAKTHVQCPVVDTVANPDGTFTIYFSSRDQKNVSRIGSFNYDFNKKIVVSLSDRPLLDLGRDGCFDDSGVMPTSIVRHQGQVYLFYIGWTQKVRTSYQNSIGLAIRKKNGQFRKCFEGPVIGQDRFDPIFTGTCWVMPHGSGFISYYLSCTEWRSKEPRYNIKMATSENLVEWKKLNRAAIEYSNDNEGGIASASVVANQNLFHMWYSFRGSQDYRSNLKETYRIGYAKSRDGTQWQRDDLNVGISLGQKGEWDSEMICYPYVFNIGEQLVMLYNGNGFGKSGIGMAKLPIQSLFSG